MEPETNQQSAVPQLCKSGCGFYGNASTDGLCSKCYKDTVVRTTQASNNPTLSLPTTNSNHYDNPSKEPLHSDQINQVLNLLNASKSSLLLPNNSTANQILDFSSIKSNFFDNNNKQKEFLTSSPKTPSSSSHTPKEPNNDAFSESPLNNNINTIQFKDGGVNETTNIGPSDILKLGNSVTDTKSPSILSQVNSPQSVSELLENSNSNDFLSQEKSSDSPSVPSNRCFTCRKKIGLSGFPCRCNHNFCSAHRYSDQHNCTFDYKELAQSEIRKNNPVVAAQKIQKI